MRPDIWNQQSEIVAKALLEKTSYCKASDEACAKQPKAYCKHFYSIYSPTAQVLEDAYKTDKT